MLARRRNNSLNSVFGSGFHDSLLNHLFSGFGYPVYSDESRSYVIPVDIESNDEKVTVTASLPGVSADNVDVSVENGILTINNKTDVSTDKGDGNYVIKERRQGLASRSIRLPKDADVDSAEVSLKDGVLTIQFKNGHPRQVKSLPISTK